MRGERILVSGQVQGVGFRPAVWRLAQELGLAGEVRNLGDAVEITVFGHGIDAFADRLLREAPPLAHVKHVSRTALDQPAPDGFAIGRSEAGAARAVTPDAATCAACRSETRDPFARRFRYPFTNCTACGPRFSIIEGVPYDRERTTMRAFATCPDCAAEYADPADRRFHAQPIACHACGPRAWIERLGGGAVHHESFSMLDAVDAVGGMLNRGHIVAIKGLGGFHLTCDATDAQAVQALRERKRRRSKAFALMARDLDVVRAYCAVDPDEAALLESPAAPIVLLRRCGRTLPDAVAPGLDRLGVMVPATPMHHLLLRRVERPVVMTSGNVSGRPQCIGNEEARRELAGIAEFALMHDRDIANRLDDSVVRVDLGRARSIRRARGYAPRPIRLPAGFETAPDLLAMGAELKNAFCLVRKGEAILSQHLGDLSDPHAADEAERTRALYTDLYGATNAAVAVDKHRDYAATRAGLSMARCHGLPLVEVQHHHAHAAACMAENEWSLAGGPVLAVVMDGTGAGDDGTVWGGEFLLCDCRRATRLACLKPVAMPGGERAAREPWRSAYAHLTAEMRWPEFDANFSGLAVHGRLAALPRPTLDGMIAGGVNAPLASSCGRLFDAAAALCGLAWEALDHEGQAAMAFEAAIDPGALGEPDELAYPFPIPTLRGTSMPYIEPLSAWRALLGDLHLATPVGVVSARFHRGLARAIAAVVRKLDRAGHGFGAVALSGGCFQNATLFRLVHDALAADYAVLTHAEVPANDGGIALGQAAVAAATLQGG